MPLEARYPDLGRKLLAARKAQHLNQRELAKQVGLSHGYFPKLERGLTQPTPSTLRTLARVLDLDYEELAILAGYLPHRRGEPSAAEHDQVRKFLRLPPELRDWLLQLAEDGQARGLLPDAVAEDVSSQAAR